MTSKSGWKMPKVGMGATEHSYSDRNAYSVTRVSDTGKTFWARMDKATRTDKGGMTDTGQTYGYEPDPEAPEVAVRWSKKGWSCSSRHTTFTLGIRAKYHDFSF